MLGFFKQFFKKSSAAKAAPSRRATLNTRKLCKIISCFSVGNSIKYYLEYRQEVMLDTIIIACQINNEIIYSNSEIVCSPDGNEISLNGTVIDEIHSFALLIPSVGRGESELNYEHKEILGKSGGFIKGNVVTLSGEHQNGKIPIIDSVVRKYMRLKGGYYNNLQVVVLNIDPTLLELKDQRNKIRLKAEIPGTIQATHQSERYDGTIIDFADNITKIFFDDRETITTEFSEGNTVILSFDLPPGVEKNVMQGTILRIDESSMVIRLEDILKGKSFEKLAAIDLIEIKARLLQLQPSAPPAKH